MRLEEYKQSQGFTYEKLVSLIGVPRSTLHRICDRNYEGYCVKLVDAHKIMRATHGAVALEDLLPLEGDC